jgi:hypothetical protein
MRNNLAPKVGETGVQLPLWFGSGIHWALRLYYDPFLSRDPVETFQTWWELQWHGGIVNAAWLDTMLDRSPKEINVREDNETEYVVKGLKDLLADPDITEFEEHRELGIGMMTYYKDYALENDNFAVIMAEHTFSVPIIDPEGHPFFATDPRDGEAKQVHLRGTQDAIIQDLESGQFGVLEHKTTARIDESYFLKLDKDPQVTTYMYAAEREAEQHDLEYRRVDFTIYNALRKAYPKPPTEVRGGYFSINRATESTTPELLQQFIDERGIGFIVEEDAKLSAYVDYVREQGHSQFVIRNNPQEGSGPVRRNRAELKNAGIQIFQKAFDMLDDPVIYPNPTGEFYCVHCPFRGPCIGADDGSDYKMMLNEGYEKNWNR